MSLICLEVFGINYDFVRLPKAMKIKAGVVPAPEDPPNQFRQQVYPEVDSLSPISETRSKRIKLRN
ncbi:hypothetical protein PanWU01x14_102180 [Parasponia andersonii]|uniref:Uncharacterized protein n=1 Tax=Parasponia andersonii TaxID=3476 RepID=A0A2P5D2Q8_PARAD|nr:hypothetical protein PanWU01x14_102180 [Parasponia andersonii]